MRIFLFLFIFCGSLSLQAQAIDRTNFRAGLHGGAVLGDFSEAYSFVLGVDLYHHWGISKELDIGLTTGFTNAFGETQTPVVGEVIENEFSNIQFIPVAGSVRIYISKGFKVGSDVGYALGLTDDAVSGFYYKPSIGFDMNYGSREFNISYAVIEGGTANYTSVLAGFLILF